MKNIPVFTTEAGVASLVLEEIPYKRIAYIRLQSTSSPRALLNDAVALCRAAGADTIYACGNDYLKDLPLYTEIVQMECEKRALPTSDLVPVLVDDTSLNLWCELYNAHMYSVPNAATMTKAKADEMRKTKDAYLVYDGDVLIGIGRATEGKVNALVSVVQGRGRDVMLSLCSLLDTDIISVEVAKTNYKAINLYRRLGFLEKKLISTWYCV